MKTAEKTEKALIRAAKKEAARLEKMGVQSQRLAFAMRELIDMAEECMNEGGHWADLGGHWADFICDSRGERGINTVYNHFFKLSAGGCFLVYDDDIAERYKWQPKHRPSDGLFYIKLQAVYLARAWEHIKAIEAKL